MLFCSSKQRESGWRRRLQHYCPPAALLILLCMSMVVTAFPLFVFIRLFLYELDWPGFRAVLRCSLGEPNALRNLVRPRSDDDFCQTRNRMQNLLTTRNFPCSKLFHDSYFSLDVVRLFFLSFLFQRVSHTQRECQRATFCAVQRATSGRSPGPSDTKPCTRGATGLDGTAGALNLHNFRTISFPIFSEQKFSTAPSASLSSCSSSAVVLLVSAAANVDHQGTRWW